MCCAAQASGLGRVRTTGAGDGFAAGWLLAVTRGADPLEAVAEGHAVAARVLRRPGADLAPADPRPQPLTGSSP